MISLRLTADELGLPEFLAADMDARKYPRPHEGYFAAQRYGTLCAARIADAVYRGPWITPDGTACAIDDAVMFAKFAFHGWRAYRMMVGE